MSELGKVLLITGPASSGKSTLAERVAKELGWKRIGEDEYWFRRGWRGLRSPEQEAAIQQEVLSDLLSVLRLGRSAVLEFILYSEPPNPLTAYQAALRDNSASFTTVALKPSVAEILSRMQVRGRPTDMADIEARRLDAENQVRVLESVDPSSLIDSTDLSIDDAVRRVLDRVNG